MTGGARPGADVPAASQHEAAAQPGDTAAGRVAVPAGGRVRSASRRGWPWVWALASGVVAAAAVRVPGAASDARAAFAHAGGLRVSWLGVAVAAEVVALAGGAAAQRRLLSAAGVSLPWRTVSGVVFTSTGLARVMPAGPVAGGAWQAAEYRRRGAGAAAGLRAVLAGGFTSTVAVSGLLLAGAAVAGTGSFALLAGAAAVLAAGTAGLAAAAHHAGTLSRRHHRSRAVAPLAAAVAGLSRQRAGFGWAAGVLARTVTGLLADAGLLAACFGLAGLPVPWRGLLFAYAAGSWPGGSSRCPAGSAVSKAACSARSRSPAPGPQRPQPRSSSTRWPDTGPSVPPGPWRRPPSAAAAAAGLGAKLSSSQRAALTRARTAFRPWQRSPNQPAPRGLPARVRDPGALPHPRPPAGPGRARSGTRRTDAARSREPKAPATACPASRGCPKPGDTDGTDRTVVRGGQRHRLRLPRHAVRQQLASRRRARAATRRRTRAAAGERPAGRRFSSLP